MTPQPVLPKNIASRKITGTPSPMRTTETTPSKQASRVGSPTKLAQPHQGGEKTKTDFSLKLGSVTERTKPVPNFELSDYEKHQTLPYLWYSGSIEEQEFLTIALE